MTKIEKWLYVARKFFQEACEFLEIDSNGYVFKIEDFNTPLYTAFPQHNKNIAVGKDFLMTIIEKKSSTVLRIQMYVCARLIYQQLHPEVLGKIIQTQNIINLSYNEIDSISFSIAIALIKGIQPPDIRKLSNCIAENVLRILKDEFCLECVFGERLDGASFGKVKGLRLKLRESEEEKYIESKLKSSPQIIDVNPVLKGTKDNPFNNIDEAIQFVKMKEERAYNADKAIQDIAKEQYFYDTNSKQFRIEFARPYVVFNKNNYSENSFIVNQLQSGRFSIKPNLYSRKFLYRGQTEDYPTCKPSLFRDENKIDFMDEIIWNDELHILLRSHPLVQLLGTVGIELLHDNFIFEMNSYGLSQHYGNKTPFLDLTSNLKAARFFATNQYLGMKENKYVPYMKDGVGVLYYYELKMPNAFQDQEIYHLTTIGKQVFSRSGAQFGFLFRMSKELDFNDLPETHKVYFRHDPLLSKQIYDQCEGGNIYWCTDALSRTWTEKLKLEGKVSLEAVKENIKRNYGETIESITKRLASYNIKVDSNYQPSFSDLELDCYYQDIANGWWEDEFCKDIHFNSPESFLYEEEMKLIRFKDEYKSWFKKN